jgi:hypothetical protein
MAVPNKVSVVAAISRQFRGDAFQEVVKQLEAKGLAVGATMDKLNFVTGQVEKKDLQSLRAVDGVVEVREEKPVGLASV